MSEVDIVQPSEPTSTRPERWHDLDALRGFAMVLGIALHVSLAFFPGFWPAQDITSDADGPYDEFFHAVHGFRMPLFFLLSGFFTTMLWRRRGLAALLGHRLRRIALPLALGLVTIVPAVNWAVEWAVDNGVADYVDQNNDIWAAAFFGNTEAVEVLLDRGFDVNAGNEADKGDTALHLAAFTNDVAMIEFLIERGADPAVASTDGTPMNYAVFLGNREAAEALVAGGAVDPRLDGASWEDVPIWAEGEALAIDKETVLGLDSWLASFHHLWFLWFLLWLVVGFALVAVLIDRAPLAGTTEVWSGPFMWALIPLTLVPQLAMGDGGNVPAFGPDTSTGLVPEPHVLAYYGVFFAFGALLYGRPNRRDGLLVETLGRWWKFLLPLALFIAFPAANRLTFDPEGTSWLLVSIAQIAYTWLMIVALMGLFRYLLAKERRGVRYLSDSAYWLYLAHLPLVIIGQSLIRNWDLPSGVKFLGLTLGLTALLLASYQLLVRYTPIGTLLNGKRTRPTT